MPATITRNKSTIQQLRALEDVLSSARTWAMNEAMALLEIKEKQLYLVTDFKKFEPYAVTRWGYDRSTIFRLVQWAQAIRILSPIGTLPQRESISRPLHGLDPQQQIRAWKAATRSNPEPTAKDVQQAVDALPTREKAVTGQQRGTGEIVRGDAAQMLRKLKDGSVNLIFTSPPFCEQRQDFPAVKESDFPAFTVAWMESARPKMTSSGSIIIEIREHVRRGEISDYLLKTRLAIRAAGWRENDCMVNYRPDSPPLGRIDRPRRAYSYLLWYSLSSSPFCDPYACGGDRKTRAKNISAKHGREIELMKGDTARISDVFVSTVGSVARGVDHPAMLSETLADQIVRTFTKPGQLVVDPFCGSGTTLVAATNAGRNYWGCDVVGSYVTIARQRLAIG